ncbi:MAG: nucleotidyltransferase family protein [Chloroflexi bacterium]|nr:nucleotidyltransferase family protein [Chloroflexota bacterium]
MPVSPNELYRVLCQLLADGAERPEWAAFTSEDWRGFTSLAVAEGVAPLVYWRLRQSHDDIPSDLLKTLAAQYYMTAAENTLLYAEMARILAAFGAERVPVIVLKGAVLAKTIYPDPALRPMSDLDLLVPRKDIERASTIIRDLDYQEVAVQSRALNRYIGTQVNFLPLTKSGHEVELHWGLIAGSADRRTADVQWFWENSELWQLSSGPELMEARILSPTANLLYLTAHLILQHGGAQSRLLWYYDLHLLISQLTERLNWNIYLEQALALRWAASQLAGLKAVQVLFNTPIPSRVLTGLSAQYESLPFSSSHLASSLMEMKVSDHWDRIVSLSWRAKLLYLLAMVFPSPAFLRRRYSPRPDWLWPALYPLRWVEMAHDGLIVLAEQVWR